MVDSPDRATSNLRGWLSDVYLPALLSRDIEGLARRLGDRATLDDPLFGRATGPDPLSHRLDEIAAWLASHNGAFERTGFLMGSDRDITEGRLAVTVHGRRVEIPVAIVAERRREREVELRVYYSTRILREKRVVRAPLLAPNEEATVPPPVITYLDALDRGDLDALIASFEEGATLQDGVGRGHAKHERGPNSLHAYYARLISTGGSAAGTRVIKNARADDGRACALEYSTARIRGRDVPPEAGFAVFERGESGLLHAVRVYDDIDAHGEDGSAAASPSR